MISNRLKSLASYITASDIPLDIGCDHALLDIYLIKKDLIDNCYVSDINPKALQNAKDNIKNNNLDKQIRCYLSDGLKNINNNAINTLIISGMGTTTIIGILSLKDKLKKIDKIIIQSNNDYYKLRKYITNNGFYITNEEVIFDNNKFYENIVAKKGYKKYSKKELLYGPILSRTKTSIKYYDYLLHNYQKVLDLVPKMKIKTRLELKYKMFSLKKVIKKLK